MDQLTLIRLLLLLVVPHLLYGGGPQGCQGGRLGRLHVVVVVVSVPVVALGVNCGRVKVVALLVAFPVATVVVAGVQLVVVVVEALVPLVGAWKGDLDYLDCCSSNGGSLLKLSFFSILFGVIFSLF